MTDTEVSKQVLSVLRALVNDGKIIQESDGTRYRVKDDVLEVLQDVGQWEPVYDFPLELDENLAVVEEPEDKIAALEKRVKELEEENLRLKTPQPEIGVAVCSKDAAQDMRLRPEARYKGELSWGEWELRYDRKADCFMELKVGSPSATEHRLSALNHFKTITRLPDAK